MSQDETLTFQQQIVLEQMRRNYNFTQEALKSVDTKAQGVIAIASIVITILLNVRASALQNNLGVILGVVLFLYGLTMFFALWAIFPANVESEPLKAEWEYIYNSLNDPPFDFFHNLLSAYVDVIQTNLATNGVKTARLGIAYFFLVLTVALVLILPNLQL
jgi:hypothetical protein